MEPGDLVGGRFRLQEAVGAGGMGAVFRALDETTGQLVAVKLIEVRDDVEIARSRREAQALARLQHPAIVRYVGDGRESDKLFLAMQWVDGVTVGQRLAGKGFTLRETIAVVRRVAGALAVAHAAGILHRDVKPSNVMLAGDDAERAMLIDFGIARLAGDRTLTRTGTTLGTPGYMAPEQARGERELSPAVDVFSLGCLLFECATGRPAFSGTLRAALLTKILFAQPEPFDALCPEAPPDLVALLERMLEKDPHARPANGAEVVAAIARIGEPPQGPRRDNSALEHAPTARASSSGHSHCLVLASRGHPDETLDRPEPAELARLRTDLERWNAQPVELRTGAVVIHLEDERDLVAHRAAHCALATKQVFTDWTVVVTALEGELAGVADHGTQLLTTAALAMIFRKMTSAGVVIDASLAPLLEDEFELEAGDSPRLLGVRDA